MEDRLRTEKNILDFIYVEQLAYLNQIVRGLGIKNKHSVKSGLTRLLDKKEIKRVPSPNGSQRNHFYALKRYRSRLTPNEIEKERRLWRLSYTKPKKFLALRKKEFLKSRLKELEMGVTNSEFFKNTELMGKSELKTEILRIMKRGVEKHGISFFICKAIIVLSETILTKNHTCALFNITPQALEKNIKKSSKLQLLRQNLKKEIKKAAKENVRVIPQIIDNKLMIAWVKNSVAKKYGYG